MRQDFKGFIHADFNGHSNGSGFFTLSAYVQAKFPEITFSEFIGINVEKNKDSETVYAVIKNDSDEIVRYKLPISYDELFNAHVFKQASIMLFDKGVKAIKELEEVYKLGGIRLIQDEE